MILRNYCCICNHLLPNAFYSLSNVPIRISTTEKPSFELSELSYAQCNSCKTIQLNKLIPLHILYETSHNFTSVGNTWEQYFNTIVNILRPIVQNKNVLEIGDPSGKIANRITNNWYNHWYIVEPNQNKSIKFASNITFIPKFFDYLFQTNYEIDVIVHSHLFEHIYEYPEFLKKCHDILSDNGEMVFGIPNMEYIAQSELAPFLGVFFEHTVFLNKQNIRYLLESHGFEIVEITDYENHSIIYHTRKTGLPINSNNILPITDYKLQFETTLDKYKEYIYQIHNLLQTQQSKPVYVFGASYNTQLLLSLGLNKENITGILDNCIEKQGKYLSGFEIQIFSPDILRNNDSIVILKNGYYSDEIRKQILNISPTTIII